MSILKLVTEAPKLCGAKNAERYGKIAELVYRHEAENNQSVFAHSAEDEENPQNRIESIFAWKASTENKGKKQYIMDLMEYAMEKHYHAEHGKYVDLEPMKTDLLVREPLYPDVSAIQSVESVSSAWI